MIGSPAVKIAGIGLNWTEDFAEKYRRRLEEMDFIVKKVSLIENTGKRNYVAYSHRPFTHEEMMEVINELFPQNERIDTLEVPKKE